MANASAPILQLKLSGEGLVTSENQSIAWNLSEKLEDDIYISSTQTIVIDYSNIDNIRFIMFIGNGTYKVSITSSGNTIEFEVQDIFVFTPTNAFMSSISNIQLTTDSTTNIKVKIRVYGEVSV